jgi:hypothetical protein
MKKQTKRGDPLDNLASLVSGQPTRDNGEGLQEQTVDERRVEVLINFAVKMLGGQDSADIFEVQELIEAAADQMRYDIREMVSEEGEDDA